MRYLTPEECRRFDVPGGQNEVTPVLSPDGVVIGVYTYTQHAAYRTRHLRMSWSSTYARLVAAIERRDI